MGIKKWLLKNSNSSDKNSLASHFRRKRIRVFENFYKESILSDVSFVGTGKKRKVTILDVGGSYTYWKSIDFKYFNTAAYTLLNLYKSDIPNSCNNMVSVVGDATDLSEYEDNQFDLVFSNSVIEHVGDFEAQRKMVQEMCRTGKHCYLQTPNRYFFMEPHFLIPFFQFFPLKIKVFLILHCNIQNIPKAKNYTEALEIAKSVRLMTKRELSILFPGIKIRKEKFLFMTKSFYLYF